MKCCLRNSLHQYAHVITVDTIIRNFCKELFFQYPFPSLSMYTFTHTFTLNLTCRPLCKEHSVELPIALHCVHVLFYDSKHIFDCVIHFQCCRCELIRDLSHRLYASMTLYSQWLFLCLCLLKCKTICAMAAYVFSTSRETKVNKVSTSSVAKINAQGFLWFFPADSCLPSKLLNISNETELLF